MDGAKQAKGIRRGSGRGPGAPCADAHGQWADCGGTRKNEPAGGWRRPRTCPRQDAPPGPWGGHRQERRGSGRFPRSQRSGTRGCAVRIDRFPPWQTRRSSDARAALRARRPGPVPAVSDDRCVRSCHFVAGPASHGFGRVGCTFGTSEQPPRQEVASHATQTTNRYCEDKRPHRRTPAQPARRGQPIPVTTDRRKRCRQDRHGGRRTPGQPPRRDGRNPAP